MIMKKLLIGLVALTALAGIAIAQVPSLIIASPTGLEQIEVFVPSTGTLTTGPQKVQVTINQIRNATGYLLVAAGTTVSTVMTGNQQILVAQGAITTWNITLPASPEDGALAKITCPGGNTGTLAISAAALPASTSIVGTNPTSCTASSGGGANFVYSLSANTWYRV
jgi:hypothetical protein